MVALVGQWWLERRSPGKEQVAAHLVDLAYNGLAHLQLSAGRRPRGPRAGPRPEPAPSRGSRSEEHTSELQSRQYLVCRLLLEKKNKKQIKTLLQLLSD